jgi:hypothetical protein
LETGSCIAQDKAELFTRQLDNIQTAVLLSDIVLVVPKVQSSSGSGVEMCLSDLEDIGGRGWCTFEAVSALLAQTEVFVTFVCEYDSCFVKASAEGFGFQLSLDDFVNNTPANLKACQGSYGRVINQAISILCVDAPEDKRWLKVQDPSNVALEVYKYVQRSDAGRHASMTVPLRENDRDHVLLKFLENFKEVSDRGKVLNLLCNVAGFCNDGYQNIKERSVGEVDALAERLEADSASNFFKIDLRNRGLFAKDAQAVLQAVLQLEAVRKDMQAATLTIRFVQDIVVNFLLTNLHEML